jgi:hypothetical protein
LTNVALVDPKFIDGEPWEIAEKAGAQLAACLELALEALNGFEWAARGSWLTQEDTRTGRMPASGAFERTPYGVKLAEAQIQLKHALKDTRTITAAAAADPREWVKP